MSENIIFSKFFSTGLHFTLYLPTAFLALAKSAFLPNFKIVI